MCSFFFFSSRRRHTRCYRDWSSDVCSSDLNLVIAALMSRGHPRFLFPQLRGAERAIERAHGATLEDWDGRVPRREAVDPILRNLLKGGYRRFHGGPNA